MSTDGVDRTVTVLLLGAWGCGAFRNDPVMAAASAASCLRSERFEGVFDRIVFAIPDSGGYGTRNLMAFRDALCTDAGGGSTGVDPGLSH